MHWGLVNLRLANPNPTPTLTQRTPWERTCAQMERAIKRSLRQSTAVEDAEFTPMHCHRLDMATGGVLVAAKTRHSLTALCAAFEDRRVTKRYLALVVVRPDSGPSYSLLAFSGAGGA